MTTYALDCAFSFPDPFAAAKLGYKVCVRYFARPGSQTTPKLWTPSQIALCHSAGMSVGGVFEQDADTPLKGYNEGVADCHIAESQWSSLNGPHGTVIGYAYDFDPDPSQVVPYAEGVKATASGNWPIMAYCSDAVAVELFHRKLIDYFWQTESSGFHGRWPSPIAHMIQHTWYDLRPKMNVDYDENVLHPENGVIPFWAPPGQGGPFMALTDAEQTELRDEVRAMKKQMDQMGATLNHVYNFVNSFPSQNPFPGFQAELDAIKAKTDHLS